MAFVFSHDILKALISKTKEIFVLSKSYEKSGIDVDAHFSTGFSDSTQTPKGSSSY